MHQARPLSPFPGSPSVSLANRRPASEAYGLLLGCCLVLALVRWFNPLLGSGAAGTLFALLPAFACALRSGGRFGLAAGVLSTLIVLLVRPHAIQPPPPAPATLLSLTLLLLWSFALSGFGEMLHRARREAGAARAAREAADRRAEALFESLRDWAIIVLDPNGHIRGWSAGARRLFGCPPEEVLGRHLCRLFTSQAIQVNAPERDIREATEFGRAESDDWRVRADGSQFRARSILVPLRSGAVSSGFMLLTRDITATEREEAELRASLEELRSLAQHLHATKEAERGRIAREMHDELGQSLACLKMDVVALRGDTGQTEGERDETCRRLVERVDGAIRSMRRLVTELRPRVLDDLGLSAGVEWQAQEFESRTGIRCEIEQPIAEVTLDRERSAALFRIFQESLTNVARHSGATHVWAALREQSESITLEVRDNGSGMPQPEPGKRSMGLLGMQERALAFGGQLTIGERDGGGTVVTARLPSGGRPV